MLLYLWALIQVEICCKTFSMSFFNTGICDSIIPQTSSKSIPKYSCARKFRNEIIFFQGMSAYLFLRPADKLFAASPIISNWRSIENLTSSHYKIHFSFYLMKNFRCGEWHQEYVSILFHQKVSLS